MERIRTLAAVALALACCGCGAAYYGTALGIIATQKKRKTTDLSFPDAVPADGAAPALAIPRLGSSQVTVVRDGIQVTDYPITSLDFPAGYGETRSNRDARRTLAPGERLVLRLHGDSSRTLDFQTPDFPAGTASVGSEVASVLQAKVNALAPLSASVPAQAYTGFTVTFDEHTRSYLCRDGLPGEGSEVVFEPAPRAGTSDVSPDATSGTTAAALGLGSANGALEQAGADTVALTVVNRGTDSIPAGTGVDLYLSRDKVLEPATDLLFDRVVLPEAVAVGQALRVFRRNGTAPPNQLVRQDLGTGRWFLIFSVQDSGESDASNNTLVLPHTIQVSAPVDDPATAAVETAADLDFAITAVTAPIAQVTGNNLVSRVTITNLGAAVASVTTISVDVLLSSDGTLDEPGGYHDPSGVVAGFYLNPTNPVLPVTLTLDPTGTGAVTVGVTQGSLTLRYNPATATVQQAVDALNGSQGSQVEALTDGRGTPATDLLTALVTASGSEPTKTGDVFVVRKDAVFPAVTRQQESRTFDVTAQLRQASFRQGVLPARLFPLFRIRPPNPGNGVNQNTNNDLRQCGNYVRVYDRAAATFDALSGATLPTVNSDDFARLEAVTTRPVNAGTIRQGQQRVFSFEIPATGLTFDESQLLVILRSGRFDAHVDLLGPSGEFLSGSDDGALGLEPLLYLPVQSASTSRLFYLVVSPARIDESDVAGGGEAFELTISVNPRRPGDLGSVLAFSATPSVAAIPRRYASGEQQLRHQSLLPFSLENARAELMFVLPARARLRLATRPVPQVGISTVLTGFVAGVLPAPVEHQAVLDESLERIVYRPSGGATNSWHTLEGGVYTMAFDGQGGVPDLQSLRLELEAEFLPPP